MGVDVLYSFLPEPLPGRAEAPEIIGGVYAHGGLCNLFDFFSIRTTQPARVAGRF